uniref:Glutamate receptor-interacting protein 1 n=1 Tax=Panagrellus redivivus TaxID=6233 RepID=A0A7E4UN49_PANRE
MPSTSSGGRRRRPLLRAIQIRAKRVFYQGLIRIVAAALDDVIYAPQEADSHSDDNTSMIVNNPSLKESKATKPRAAKSQSSIVNVGKSDFFARLLPRRRRKVERRISLPSQNGRKLPPDEPLHVNYDAARALVTTKSQFDINTVERRIALAEQDRHNSIDDIKNYDETDEVEFVRRRSVSNAKKRVLDATTPPSTPKNHYRSRSVPAPVTPQLCSTSTVVLRRRNGQQLGLGIAGGADRAIFPTISFLRPGYIAHRCDQLQPGERLLAVNDIQVKPLTHEQILTVLRSAGDVVKLEIEYSLNDPVFMKPKNTMSKCAEIILEKETGGFGFTIRGGSYGPDIEKCRPITVTAIRPGGPAHREGRLRVGDRIININGIDVFSATLGVAQKLIQDIDVCCRFMVEYDVSILETVRHATGPLMVEVDKNPGADFGLTLVIFEKTDNAKNITKRGVFVEAVEPASIADRCGAIHAGDEILSIDGISLEYTTLDEATQLLKGHCSTVKLEIVPYSQMNAEESARKSRRRFKGAANNNGLGKRNDSKRSESCDYHPSYGVRAFEPRARSTEKGIVAERQQQKKSHRFQSNAVQEQQKLGLSGSVPTVAQNPPSVMTKSTDMSKSMHAEALPPSSSRSTGSVSGSLFSAIPNGQVCHMETMEVFLQTQSSTKSGFGLILNRHDGKSTDADSGRFAPLFIAYIEKGSPADKCGVLQVGDRVLAINDWHTANSTIDEANHILRHASQAVTLTVEFDVIESVLPSSGVFTVKLAKRGSNLGIICRSETNGEKGEPVVISEIRTGSVAHRCGSIQQGDQIVAIDNIPLASSTVEEAMRLLQRSGDVVKLSIKKGPSDSQEVDSSQIVVYSIELTRKGQPVGITIASSGERGDPIIISQLASGGLAERTGALHVGDRILAINNESLDGKMVSEAMYILQQSTEVVTLKISRVIDPPPPQQFVSGYSPLSPLLFGRNRTLGAGMIHPLSTIRSDSVSETSGKLSTPIQSIDSAVESLEDSPNGGFHKNMIMSSSSQHTRLSDDSHKRTTDASANRRSELVNSGRQNSSTSARSFSKPPSSSNDAGSSVERTGWDSGLSSTADTSHTANECCACSNNTNDNDNEDWKRILEALETVGEAEMLKKLEESIMTGHVPNNKTFCQCNILTTTDDAKPSSSLLTRRNQSAGSGGALATPGYMNLNTTSTILKHPPLYSQRDFSTSIETPKFRSQSPCSDGTLEMPPSMPPPKPHISAMSDIASDPQRLDNLLNLLSEQMTSMPMIDGNLSGSSNELMTERVVFSVTLKKDPNIRTFGFSVSDGPKGVYINALSPGSPADRCGRIMPNDRILQINETDIQDLGCSLAVPLLAAEEVHLVLERTTIVPASPKSSRTRGSAVQSAV